MQLFRRQPRVPEPLARLLFGEGAGLGLLNHQVHRLFHLPALLLQGLRVRGPAFRAPLAVALGQAGAPCRPFRASQDPVEGRQRRAFAGLQLATALGLPEPQLEGLPAVGLSGSVINERCARHKELRRVLTQLLDEVFGELALANRRSAGNRAKCDQLQAPSRT